MLIKLPCHCLLHTALKGSHWPVQASLRLSRMQKKQLAVQGRENAAVVGHTAGAVRRHRQRTAGAQMTQ